MTRAACSWARGLVPRAASLLAVALAACVAPDPDHSYDRGAEPVPGVVELPIDRGGQVELPPGEGIGVAVEYAGEGQWSVATTCDTAVTGEPCRYDLLVSTDEDAPITSFSARELEDDDGVRALDDFAVAADLSTEQDADGFELVTVPGATVRVSALLYDPGVDRWFDWSEDPRFISWVGDGGVHVGAPTNPVDLTPDRP